MVLNLDKKIKEDTIIINGEEYPFKALRPAGQYASTQVLNEIKTRVVKTQEEEDKLLEDIHKFLGMIIDAPEDVLETFGFEHFVKLLDYLDKKPLLDQGFTEREIERMGKDAYKKVLSGEISLP